MIKIAEGTLAKVPSEMLGEGERVGVATQLVGLQKRMKQSLARGLTPRKYINLVAMWNKVFLSARQKVSERVEHLKGGLDKLVEAGVEVDKLSKSASEQRQKLTASQAAADKAMDEIQKSIERSSERRVEVEKLQNQLSSEEVQMTARKEEVEVELSRIQPVLEAARQAVGSIKSDNLNEIRMLKMPPEAIRDVLEGVVRPADLRGGEEMRMEGRGESVRRRDTQDSAGCHMKCAGGSGVSIGMKGREGNGREGGMNALVFVSLV